MSPILLGHRPEALKAARQWASVSVVGLRSVLSRDGGRYRVQALGDGEPPGGRAVERGECGRPAVVVVDRPSRRRPRQIDATIFGAGVRRHEGWWAAVVMGDDASALESSLRRSEFALGVADPKGRVAAWVGGGRRAPAPSRADAADSLIRGSGVLWAPRRGAGEAAAAWDTLRRAHAAVLIREAAALTGDMCAGVRRDDPVSARLAVQWWLVGDEGTAVDVVRSVVAVGLLKSRRVPDGPFSLDEFDRG